VLRKVDIITIFPELVEHFLAESLVGSARERGLVELRAHDLRRFTADRRRTVDDAPYGGGPGMVMKPEPLVEAIEAVAGEKGQERQAKVVLLSPQGRALDQALLEEWVHHEHLVLVCGRYEGVDQRVVDLAVDEELSIGDYVLCGGEVPAMVLVEGLLRLAPGVLGNPESARQESFGGRLLEGPHYTRPPSYRGLQVPEVLLSGDHAAIARWRQQQADSLTRLRRPDLLAEDAPPGDGASETGRSTGPDRQRSKKPDRQRSKKKEDRKNENESKREDER
jgi:tRNA (guanine37-N1)-methyltransferase